MNKKDTVVVFGGSFNPPINSHFCVAEHVLNEYEQVEKVIFIPVNKKYEKDIEIYFLCNGISCYDFM